VRKTTILTLVARAHHRRMTYELCACVCLTSSAEATAEGEWWKYRVVMRALYSAAEGAGGGGDLTHGYRLT
jgi:hypothetical protein